MSKIDYRNVEKVPGICGGRAVIAGTRIRVSIILGCSRLGMTVEEIIQSYPHLRSSDVYDALAYAAEHPTVPINGDGQATYPSVGETGIAKRNGMAGLHHNLLR